MTHNELAVSLPPLPARRCEQVARVRRSAAAMIYQFSHISADKEFLTKDPSRARTPLRGLPHRAFLGDNYWQARLITEANFSRRS
jgi:hypothetical protein